LTSLPLTAAFPSYGSLAGLSERELASIIPSLKETLPGKVPGPLKFNGTKLINDAAHPWKPLRPGDIRGPCPGLNTLASHGYLPRDGVATPAQIINAVQEGFNMESQTARFTTYAAFLVDGNLVTDLVSIGEKTRKTGPDPPKPAIVGGLNTHAVFEGDASLTRADIFFGDNHSFNQTLWDQMGYTKTVAAELRFARIQESIATNPQFDFTAPRYFTAYAEATFPYVFFGDGRVPLKPDGTFGQQVPEDYHRPATPSGPSGASALFEAHPVQPGKNANGINSYTPDPDSADFSNFCLLYTSFASTIVQGLYPNPKGVLRRNLIINLQNLFDAMEGRDCEQDDETVLHKGIALGASLRQAGRASRWSCLSPRAGRSWIPSSEYLQISPRYSLAPQVLWSSPLSRVNYRGPQRYRSSESNGSAIGSLRFGGQAGLRVGTYIPFAEAAIGTMSLRKEIQAFRLSDDLGE
ncbi:hypothetical protein FA13DRAFT_1837000, partial [Coprinellus micaceus]